MTDTQTANTEPAPSDSSLKQPVDEMLSQRIGQYRVVRRIGRGGMGVVYEAVHETIGQRIAVKTLNQELSANPAFVKRFLTEARATVIAQHPGLVKVFDYGQIPDGPLYLQMEYLEGETLAKRLLKTGKLPIETTIRWIRQIASAMALAHARDIVHRDLKPDKITPVEKWLRGFRRASEKVAEVVVRSCRWEKPPERSSKQAHYVVA